jgi:hypothetical protein
MSRSPAQRDPPAGPTVDPDGGRQKAYPALTKNDEDGVLTTVGRKPPLSSHNHYFKLVPDWQRDEVMIYPSHVAGLLARLRDG